MRFRIPCVTETSAPQPSNPTDLAQLKAAAAQAAAAAAEATAQAAQARAAAAQAALEAAMSGVSDAEPSVPASPTPAAAPAPEAPVATPVSATAEAAEAAPVVPEEPAAPEAAAPAATPPSAPPATVPASDDGYAEQVRSGYSFNGPALPIGTYLSMMDAAEPTPVPGVNVGIPVGLLNRHALVTGATGTGKTRTLQLMAEGLSAQGVPVFLSDVKGDLTGLAEAGATSERLASRLSTTGQQWQGQAFPVELLSFGEPNLGVPVRTTVTEFGPIMLSRVLELSDTQTSALRLVFQWADQQGLALVDLGDLRDVVSFLTSTDEGKEELKTIGGISAATAGVILRQVTALEADGGAKFFGEPAMDIRDLMRTTADGRGVISALELQDFQSQGVLISTFLMWLLGELFEELPEVGDLERPKLVFFLDEAHLLFNGASKAFLEAITHTVRLIRSKGVGIVFITQSTTDVPAEVLAQLGSRVQHAVRTRTPQEAQNLKKVVATFPTSPLDLLPVLQSLGTGQAVVSVLDEKGRPTPVAPVVVNAPAAVMGPAQPATISQILAASTLMPRYAEAIDPDSASEALARRLAELDAAREAEKAAEEARKAAEKEAALREKEAAKAAAAAEKERQRLEREAEKAAERERRAAERAAERRQREFEKTVGSIGRQVTRELTRSILGNLKRR